MSASEKLKALDEQIVQADEQHWPLDGEGTLGLAGGNLVAVSTLRPAAT